MEEGMGVAGRSRSGEARGRGFRGGDGPRQYDRTAFRAQGFVRGRPRTRPIGRFRRIGHPSAWRAGMSGRILRKREAGVATAAGFTGRASMTTAPRGPLARDVMTAEPVCIEADATLRQLAGLLEFHEIGGVPVVGASGTLVGVASLTDVIRRLLAGTDERSPGLLFEVLREQQDDEAAGEFASGEVPHVEEFMTEDPLTVTEQTPV